MHRRGLLPSLLALLLLPTLVSAAIPTSREDQIVQYYVDQQHFQGAVLAARGDEVVFRKGYGSADLEWNIPNSPTTKFRIGSLTKQFTAAGILLLEERGKLALGDPIQKYYPDAPAAWEKITLADLLRHSSGIPNYTNDPEFMKFTRLPATPDELVKRVRDKPLEFAPGEQMRYSNTGYILLGMVIEKASGKRYADFLRQDILDPLGLANTGYDVNEALLPQRAAGYSRGPGGIVNAMYTDMSTPYAAGAMYSTVEDLFRWERALFGGKLLSAASLAKMTTPYKNDYGMGLAIGNNSGRKAIRHGGGIPGFNSHLVYFPERGITVVALSNLNGPGADAIADKLGAVLHGETVTLPTERKSVPVAEHILRRYVGTYQLLPHLQLWFTVEDGQLVSQATGQPKFPLRAESDTRFYPVAFEAELEFQVDASGKVTGLLHRQNGNELKAPRISDRPPGS
jgi:CubicO group peptidase (beta-lactamase class C family)